LRGEDGAGTGFATQRRQEGTMLLVLSYTVVVMVGVAVGVGLGRLLLEGFCALAAGFGRSRG
jgi:hypothetical protein